jgi:hypothetical protein
MNRWSITLVLVFALTIIMVTVNLEGQEHRRIQPIATPAGVQTPMIAGARQVKDIKPIDRQTVEGAMLSVAESWNMPGMAQKLTSTFYEKDRLMDTMAAIVPTDAKLRLISIGSYSILRQEILPDPGGDLLISRVSVIARTQVEYSDAHSGFQRREGEQEYTIKVTQRGVK